MGRQPLSPMYDGKLRDVDFDLQKNPRLAALIGVCANAWSTVDLQLGLAMGAMVGVENPASVAVFTALRNSRAQREALQAAARITLTGELLEIFDAIMIAHKTLDGQRNDVVHGIWSFSHDLPDGAVWQSVQNHANSIIGIYHAETKGDAGGYSPPKTQFVYLYSDLETLNGEIAALASAIGSLHTVLRYRETVPVVARNALARLNSEPLLQKARAEMKSSAGTPPSASP